MTNSLFSLSKTLSHKHIKNVPISLFAANNHLAKQRLDSWKNFLYQSLYVSIAPKETIELTIGSGCGSVGRAVASNSRGRGSNQVIGKILYWTFTVNYIEKTKIKKKRGREWSLFLKKHWTQTLCISIVRTVSIVNAHNLSLFAMHSMCLHLGLLGTETVTEWFLTYQTKLF